MPSECPCSISFDLCRSACLAVACHRAVSLEACGLACKLHALPNKVGPASGWCGCWVMHPGVKHSWSIQNKTLHWVLITICTKNLEIFVKNQMDHKMSRTSIQNSQDTSSGTPLFLFRTIFSSFQSPVKEKKKQ